MDSVKWFALALLVTAGLARPAAADVVPNPGGSTVVTNSTTASVSYVITPVTQRVDDYATTISANLGGNSVYSMSFLLPYSDPTVQQAVASADAILTGDGASFGAPTLASSVTALQDMVTTTDAPSLSCAQLMSGGYAQTGVNNVTSGMIVGPATVAVGACQSDTFNVNTGQTDIMINEDFQYAVPETVTTTDSYLTEQSYMIAGTAGSSPTGSGPAPVGVPEPSSLALLLAECAAFVVVSRVRP